jgi:cell division FtsZ-interacting protein ZapD
VDYTRIQTVKKIQNMSEFKQNLNQQEIKTEKKTEMEKERKTYLDLTWPSSPLVAQQHRPNTSPVPLR